MSRFEDDDRRLLLDCDLLCTGELWVDGGLEGDFIACCSDVFWRFVDELFGSRLMERRRSAKEARRSLIRSFTMVTEDLLFLTVVFVASEEFDNRRSLD
jgi:hypothetical protein